MSKVDSKTGRKENKNQKLNDYWNDRRTSRKKSSQKVVIDINEDDEQIICQGEVMRFKPGIQSDFVSRWLQMTNKSIRYYENDLNSSSVQTSQNYAKGPLVCIPIDAIESVKLLK